MANYANLLEINAINSGWQEKLKMTNDELSKLIPFAELFSIVNNDEVTVGDNQTNNRGFLVTIKDNTDDPGIQRRIIPIFNLIEQQSTVDTITNRLIRTRGIAGIQSLSVQFMDTSLYGYSIQMEMSIPTLEADIVTNNSLRKIFTLNSEWLIAYGWSKSGQSFFDQNSKVINLSNIHNGYYRILKSPLTKFDVELHANKEVFVRCRFLSRIMNALTSASLQSNRITLKEFLDTDTGNNKLKQQCPENIKKQLPLEPTIFQFVKYDPKNKQQNNISKKRGYYYLGWIIEALRQTIEGNSISDQNFKSIRYEKFLSPKKITIQIDVDQPNKIEYHTCNSPADIPIDTEWYLKYITNNESSFFSTISEILHEGSKRIAPFKLFTTIDSNGSGIFIREINENVDEYLKKLEKNFQVVISSQNSLLETCSFSGEIPKDIIYGLSQLVNVNNGETIVLNIARIIYEDEIKKKVKELSYIANLYKDFINVFGNTKTTEQDTKNNWQKFIQEKADKAKLFENNSANSNIDMGLVLRNYFFNLNLTVHGTVGIPPLMPIKFSGFLKGVDGVYIVLQTTDELSVGNFHSILECKLLEPSL